MAAVSIFMVVRKLYRTYLAFTVYIVFHLTVTAGLFYFHGWDRTASGAKAYWVLYWAGQLLEGIAALLVLAELYFQLFRQYEGLQRLARAMFRWVAAIMFLVAAAAAISLRANSDWMTQMAVVSGTTTMILLCGLLLFLFTLSSYFNLGWHHFAVGFAVGFAVHIPLMLMAFLAVAEHGYALVPQANLIIRSGFAVALLVWLGYLAIPQRQALASANMPSHNLAHWNQALLHYMR